jgi:hypothetical protein
LPTKMFAHGLHDTPHAAYSTRDGK